MNQVSYRTGAHLILGDHSTRRHRATGLVFLSDTFRSISLASHAANLLLTNAS